MKRSSASKRALQIQCQFWLRDDAAWFDDGGSASRENGDELHGLAAAEINGDLDAIAGPKALEMFRGLRELLDRIRRNAAQVGAEVLAEVSYAFSPSSHKARRLGVGLSREARDAMLEGDEYPGTIDLAIIYRRKDGGASEIEIADHKTTYVGGEPQDASDQLATYLAMACRAEGADEGGFYPIVVTPNDSRPGKPTVMSLMDIDAELDVLSNELLADVSDAQPNPGPWCRGRYCPARAGCPATQEAIEQVVPAEALVRKPYVPGQGFADEAQVRQGRTVRKLLEAALAAMAADEKAWLINHGEVSYPDGSRLYLQSITTERPMLDIPGAAELLRSRGAGAAIELSATWNGIKEAAGDAAAKEIREALRKMGALKISGYPKPQLSPPPKSRRQLNEFREHRSLIERFDEKAREALAEAEALPKKEEPKP